MDLFLRDRQMSTRASPKTRSESLLQTVVNLQAKTMTRIKSHVCKLKFSSYHNIAYS